MPRQYSGGGRQAPGTAEQPPSAGATVARTTRSLKERVGALKHLRPFIAMVWRTSPQLTAASLVLRLVRALLPIATLFVGKLIIDEVVLLVQRPGKPATLQEWLDSGLLTTLGTFLIAEFALAVLADVLGRVVSLIDSLLAERVSNASSVRLMEHAATLDLEDFEDAEFQDQLERARRQTSGRMTLMSQLLGQAQDIVTVASFAAGLTFYAPWLIALLFLALVPAFLGEAHFNARSYSLNYFRTPERRELDYVRQTAASVETAKEVKIFGLNGFLIDRYRRLAADMYAANRKLAMRRAGWGGLFTAIGTAGYYLAYAYIAWRTLAGQFSIGDLTFLAGSFRRLRNLLEGLLAGFSSTAGQALYLDDLFSFFDVKPEIHSPEKPRAFPHPIRHGFVFENVGFIYPGAERWAVRNLSFTLHAGEVLALVGENGAGKTTLGHDRRIDGRVVHKEHVDLRLHFAREFLEHQMLVLHLGAELGRLEQALAVPHQRVYLGLAQRNRGDVVGEPLVEKSCRFGLRRPIRQKLLGVGNGDVLGVLDEAVVLGVEHVVDGGESNVLVDAPVAGHEVGVEQLVVVGRWVIVVCRQIGSVNDAITVDVPKIGVGRLLDRGLWPRSIWVEGSRRCVVRDVDDEGVTRLHGVGGVGEPRDGIAYNEYRRRSGAGDKLRPTVGPSYEVAIRVGVDQGYATDILVGQHNAQQIERLRLDVGPCGHAAVHALDKLTGGNRLACCVERVFAQERLMRGMRGIGLVLIDERGRVVGRIVVLVLDGALDHHELQTGIGDLVAGLGNAIGADRDQRVVRLQRDDHHLGRALDEIEPVVEKLTEEDEPGVEAGRQTLVWCGVGDGQGHASRDDISRGAVVVQEMQNAVDQNAKATVDEGLHRDRIGDGLVDDQVGDDARIGIDHAGVEAVVRVRHPEERIFVHIVAEHLVQKIRERLVRRTEVLLPRHQIVQRAIDRPEAERHEYVRE